MNPKISYKSAKKAKQLLLDYILERIGDIDFCNATEERERLILYFALTQENLLQ